MADKRMAKWKIGLAVLGLITVGLFIFVIIRGVQSKQDRATLKSAQSIASKLNSYVDNKQKLPSSLSAAGITNVPSTISYSRKSSSSYQFCISYKSSSSDVGSQVETTLTQDALEREIGSNNFGDTNADQTELVISSSHKAGRQCQTVKPQLFSEDELFGNQGSDDQGSGSYFDDNSGDDGTGGQNSFDYNDNLDDPVYNQ